jgi:MFS family permease
MALSLPLLMAASVAPSPLYVVYQAKWGFSAATLTVIYAVYMVPLVLGLLTVGGLADQIGRRPVVVTSLLVQAVAMVVFITATGVGSLLAARVLQGLASGAALGAVTSGLLDLAPEQRRHLGPLLNGVAPAVGIGGGAAISGLLVQFAPAPTMLVYAVLGVCFVSLATAVAVRVLPVAHPPAVELSFRLRVSIPPEARRTVALLVPGVVASAALGGFYNSLSGSVTSHILAAHSKAISGLVITVLQAFAVIASTLAPSRVSPRRFVFVGSTLLALGVAGLTASLVLRSLGLFVAATALAGAGYGIQYLGAVRTVAMIAPFGQRAEPLAALNVVNYLSLAVPSIVAGEAATITGLRPTAVVFCIVLVVLAVLSAATHLSAGRA